LPVEGGTYDRTYINTGDGGMGAADPASVSSFMLDEYEVTVGRFREFVDAWSGGRGWLPAAGSGKHTHLNGGRGLVNSANPAMFETGWVKADDANIDPTNDHLASCIPFSTWTDAAGTQENLPINCVSWFEAYAFCIWDGGFLPSEAEWEYAAGGNEELEYPWGSADPGMKNAYAIYDCFFPSGSGDCTNVSNIAPVGTAEAGAGPWGQLDLAGNAWEWNLDWEATYVDPCSDCAYLKATTGRVNRGGCFANAPGDLFSSARSSDSPSYRGGIGIRCARIP
jgi:formylglycine-generating enzyme